MLDFLWEGVPERQLRQYRKRSRLGTASAFVVVRADLPGQTVIDDRKLRLFGVACVQALPEYVDASSGVSEGDLASYRQRFNRRPVWAGQLKSDPKADTYRKAMATLVKTVAVAELFADEQATFQELNAARNDVEAVLSYVLEPSSHEGEQLLAWAAAQVSQASAFDAALAARTGLVEITGGADVEKEFPDDLKSECNILRDVMGNPFRPSPVIDASVLSWNDGSVQRLAHEIYDKRYFDRLPLLVNTLEAAGCTNSDMLSHCREPASHWRGCWLMDLVLGKN
jgi:hypothetical protein